VSVRLRQLAPIVLVLGLTVGGFFVSRAHGEQDARHDSAHRAEIAATEVRDRVAQASTLVDGVRRFLAGHISPGVTTEQFGDIGERWLGPVGVPAAAWVQRVSDYERPGYERRTGHRIVEPTQSGGVRPPGPRESYLPATLVTGIPPMSVPGIDLSGASGIAAAVARPQTAYRVTATSLGKLPDGTAGLFLVQSAQRLENGGIVEPGFVVLFVPASWLLGAAADTVAPSPTSSPKLKITVGSGSTGVLRGATAGSAFTALGQRFDLRVPVEKVSGNAAILPWIILTGGLALAALAGALAVISGRRAKARAEADRLFAISPDLIVVAGFDGYFKRVNPAFEALLGYTEQEALARPYIDFVHPDDRERTLAEAGRLEEGQTTTSFDNRYVCKNGSHRWIEWTATPVVQEQLIYAVARDVTERRQAETNLREAEERNRALAEEQAALRRVATLVARRVPPEEVFAAVAQEVGQLLPVSSAAMGRYDSDGMFTTVAAWSTGVTAFPVGNRWTAEGKNVTTMVLETGGSARLDSCADATGPVGVAAREAGYRSAVGTPITVEGRLWGVMTAASTAEERLPPDTETRLVSFTELVATAIANAESRAGLARLAEQQAALRRVATLVVQGAQPAEIFSAISDEVEGFFGVGAAILKFEHDPPAIVFVSVSKSIDVPTGTRWEFQDGMASAEVYRSRRSARVDSKDWSCATGPVATAPRRLGVVSTVASPILVEDRLWGAMTLSSTEERLPAETEDRLERFTEVLATAIANAEAREARGRLAEQRAALRRVATLVAEGAEPQELFDVMAEEVGRVVGIQATSVVRYELDGTATELANYNRGQPKGLFPIGVRMNIEGKNILQMVRESSAAARIDDYSQAYGEMAEIVRATGIHSTVGVPVIAAGRVWGAMVGSKSDPGPLPPETASRMTDFTELLATAIENTESREALERLAEEQAALRRVATLVARGVSPAEVFSAVAEEVERLLDAEATAIARLEPDATMTLVASGGTARAALPVGTRLEVDSDTAIGRVLRGGRSARVDDVSRPPERTAERAGLLGIRCSVAVPIIVEGALWGSIGAGTDREQFPADTEQRLEEFTELAATAIANSESRSEIARLAEDQASLRRVATLVAEGVSPAEVFFTLCDEVNRLLDAENTSIPRLEADGTVTIVASAGSLADELRAGTRITPKPGWVLTTTLETGRPARKEDYVRATEPIPAMIRDVGIRSSVGAPIFVAGELWGVIIAGTVREHFPEDTEQRLEQFAGLAATAIANAEGRSELAASRVRIVTASDETRRRIERDLHDGTQQRLVTLAMHLRRAESTVPPELGETCRSIGQIASDVDRVIDELREIARGIHPAILSEGGLGPALRTLARRSALPVELGRVVDERLPEPIEVAAYYVISEALTNATKHAKASGVDIEAAAQNGSLRLSIRDDGVGGAEPAAGSGLLGLRDRVEALGGSIEIISPRGQGTHVIVELPLELDLSTDGGSGIEPTAAFRESSGRTSVSS
jgi:PAS domain S-box-containing protein